MVECIGVYSEAMQPMQGRGGGKGREFHHHTCGPSNSAACVLIEK